MRVLSADWVLPVEGAPIENGAVAVEDGRIAAVGTIDELGAGDHFAEAAIVPGIVNAHSHLEYAVYAGFGDGLSFAPWLATHIERKARIDRPQMEAIARLGAAQCLASGITTVGDAAFTGASAHACDELGLRAIVYLEVFGRDPSEAMKQFEEKTEYVASALSDRVQSRRVAARALHLLDRGVRRLPRPRRAGDDALQREPGRARLAASRRGADEAGRAAPHRPGRAERDSAPGGCRPARPTHRRRALRQGRRRGDRHARAPRRRSRPLPALERATGLRCRPARRAARGRASGRHRHRRHLVRPLARRVRGAASRDLGRARPQRACRRTFRRRRRSSWRRWAAPGPSASKPRSARSCPASAPTSRFLPLRALRIYHGRIRRPLSCTAAARSASWLPSSTARNGTREEDSNGTS